MSFAIPPGVLAAGGEYIALIQASSSPDPVSNYPTHWASTVTATFSP